MKDKVNRAPIDKWIKAKYPNGLYELAKEAEIPANSITKIRLGWVPKNPATRRRLAKTVGVAEAVLFPVTAGEGQAS